MNKITILRNHIEFKKTSVSSPEKLKDIERYLNKFFTSTNKTLSQIKEEDITKFINSLEFKTRTINDIKSYLKVFIKWHYPDWSSRFRNLDRICKLQIPSKAYKPEDMISLEEIQKLIKEEKDLLYKVFWSVFFYGGFRPSECANLQWNQIIFEDEGVIIKLHSTKTKKDFYKSLPRESEHLLKEWKKYNHSEFLFPSPKTDKPLKARSIRRKLVLLSKRVLGRKVVPYALRHSIATILYKDDSRKDDDTAHQLGHNKSMKATYLNLDEDSLKARARKLWIKTKALPPEERERLQQELDKQKQEMEELKKGMAEKFMAMQELFIKNFEELEKSKDKKKMEEFAERMTPLIKNSKQ